MNYQRIYDSIISNAILRSLNKKLLNYYTEKHHIIPRCLGGSNDKSNLVLLTGREHYLCHYLLVKIYKDNHKLIYALHRMIFSKNTIKNVGRYGPKLTSKEYEIIRIKHSNAVSHSQKGKMLTNEQRKAIDIFKKGKIVSNETKHLMSISKMGENNNFFGKHHTEESINKFKKTIQNKSWDDLKVWKNKISMNHADFSGKNHPRAKKCTVNNIEFGCLKHAKEYIKKNFVVDYTLRFI